MFVHRLAAGVAVAALVALSVGVIVPPANAAVMNSIVVAPGMPGPLNILPSTVIGAAKTAATAPEALMSLLLPHIKDGSFVRAADAFARGTATTAQTAVVTAEAATYAVPATKMVQLVKVVNGVSIPLAGLQVGMLSGNAAVRMAGFKDETVCRENNGVLEVISAITNGVSCADWKNDIAEHQRNLDQNAVYGPITSTAYGASVSFIKIVASPYYGPTAEAYCIKVHPRNPATDPALPAGATKVVLGYAAGSATVSSTFAGGWGTISKTEYAGTCNTTDPEIGNPVRGNGGPAGPIQVMAAATDASFNVIGAAQITLPGAAVRANIPRTFKCDVTDTAGGVTSASSVSFTEGDPVFGQILCPKVGAGKVPARTVIKEMGGAPEGDTVLDQPTTPEYQNLVATHPESLTGGSFLDLLKEGVSCFSQVGLCTNWFADPLKSSKYECQFGGRVVPQSECNTYAPRFNAENVATGQLLADPSTGALTAAPSATPGGIIAPGGSLGSPESTRQCMPTGWGIFNPIEWVMKPVGCAMEAAWVPRPSSINAGNARIQAAVTGSALGSAGLVLAAIGESGFDASGCSGIPWRFQFRDKLDIQADILNSCPGEPMHDTSVIVRGILVALLWTIAVLAWLRYLATIFGYTGFGGGRVTDAPTSVAINGGHMTQIQPNAGAIGQSSQRAIER